MCWPPSFCIALLLVASVSRMALGDLLTTQTELDMILGGQALVEDFESFSIPGGTSLDAPNPLNSDTAPAHLGILPGVTYASPNWLRFYASSLLGDDSNVLAGGDHIDVNFDRKQRAVGLYTKNISGNVTYQNSISFYRDGQWLGAVNDSLPSRGEHFFGWEDIQGAGSDIDPQFERVGDH